MAITKSTSLPNPREDGVPVTVEWIESNCGERQSDIGTPCLIWKGTQNGRGYGLVWHQGRMRAVHVVAMELRGRVRVAGMEWDHLCANRACVNHRHIEAVTHQINVARSFDRRKQASAHVKESAR